MSGKDAVYKAKFACEGGKPYKAFMEIFIHIPFERKEAEGSIFSIGLALMFRVPAVNRTKL